jgi:predicted nucleotidyltransferase
MRIDSRQLRRLIAARGFTNTKLAKTAGLSRQALHAILNKDWADVRDATVHRLVGALKLPDENVLGKDPLAGYKALAADEHAHMDFRALGLPATEPRLLDSMFIPIRVRRVAQPSHEVHCYDSASRTGAETDELSQSTAADLGALTLGECFDRHRRLLMRGEPGSGKTTLLRHVARSYAKGMQGQDGYPGPARVPLFVRLADYAKGRELDGELGLVRFVLARVQPEASPEWAEELERSLQDELSKGTCLVLLDGLDEVGRESDLPAVLRAFIARYPRNQFVLTSRMVGLDAGPWHRFGFESCEITRWQEADIRSFAFAWYASRHGEGGERQRKENEGQADELSAAILKQPRLGEFASNPLMLTIVAALHHANATLPRRRVDLYAKVVEVMLETWEAGKRDARPGDALHGILLESREFRWLLAKLALAMQQQDHLLNPRWWVTEFVQKFLRENLALEGENAKDQGDRVIRYLCERSGLLVERGTDVFGFSHRTFQEYFAACGIVDDAGGSTQDAVTLLRPYFYHPRWQEVVRLVAAQLAPPQATALLRTILDDPDPTGRFLRRGLQLALRALADGAAVADRALLDQIFSKGGVLGELKWLGIPLEVIDALRDLKATRHSADAAKMLTDIEATAKHALTLREFVTLYKAIHEPLSDPSKETDAPGTIYQQDIGGHQVQGVLIATRLKHQAPDKWYRVVLRLLREPNCELFVKLSFIEEVLWYEAEKNARIRKALEDLLARDRSPEVRAACARALRDAAALYSATAERLLDRLTKDKSNIVREACACALDKVATERVDVRDRLISLFKSSVADEIREGAVRGLRRVVLADQKLFNLFLAHARAPKESPWVRVACLCATEKALGNDPSVCSCFLACLDDDAVPALQRFAAQAVAEALGDGSVPWSPDIVAKVEAILMNVTSPCVHAWQGLARLVDAKEVRGGLRLEPILTDALASLKKRITTAFVFGSVARREQDHNSDVDLLIIGNVRLKEVTAQLHTAEQALGRVINPALYTPASFKEKYQAGDPFLLEIVRNQKIFLKGNRNELRDLVAERLSQETRGNGR